MSKLIEYPEFEPVPNINAADCVENIDTWLDKGKQDRIDKFLRPSETGHRGYRFVRDSDLTECKVTDQFFKFVNPKSKRGIHIQFVFIRYYQSSSSFYPLSFSERYTEILCRIKGTNGPVEVFTSDAALKRFIQEFNI